MLRGLFIPDIGNQQPHGPRVDIEDPLEDALGPTARKRYAALSATAPVAARERWGCRDKGFISHQDDRPGACPQPALEPPFAWRHVGDDLAKSYRGNFP